MENLLNDNKTPTLPNKGMSWRHHNTTCTFDFFCVLPHLSGLISRLDTREMLSPSLTQGEQWSSFLLRSKHWSLLGHLTRAGDGAAWLGSWYFCPSLFPPVSLGASIFARLAREGTAGRVCGGNRVLTCEFKPLTEFVRAGLRSACLLWARKFNWKLAAFGAGAKKNRPLQL